MPRILDLMLEAASAAGRSCLRSRAVGVTGAAADAAAQAAMASVLAPPHGGLPGLPVVSEEVPESHARRLDTGAVVLIDPLDGSDRFAAGDAEYAVCAALLEDGHPAAAVIVCPETRVALRAEVEPGRAECVALDGDLMPQGPWHRLRPGVPPAGRWRALIGQSELTPETLSRLRSFGAGTVTLEDSARCFVTLATGGTDLVAKLTPAMAWDLAAGDAVVRALGGAMLGPDGAAIRYRDARRRYPGFVAALRPDVIADVRAALSVRDRS